MPTMNNLHDLFEHELKDVYAAEKGQLRMLEQMQNQTRDEQLRVAVEKHLNETRNQIERIDGVFRSLNLDSSGAHCPAAEGLMKEKTEFEKMNPIAELIDVYNVGAGVKGERYEISAYEMLIELAAQLGMEDVAAPLQQNLREEQAMLERLQAVTKRMSAAQAKPDKKAQPRTGTRA